MNRKHPSMVYTLHSLLLGLRKESLQFLYRTGNVKYSPGHFHFGRFSIENTGLRNAKVAPCTIGNLCKCTYGNKYYIVRCEPKQD